MNITYYELSNYNSGILLPKTFDVEGLSHDDHLTELTNWLEELTEKTGELCEEWIVCDYENIPAEYVSEWSISAEFFDYQEALTESNLDSEAFSAGVSAGIPLDKIEDAYRGHFATDTELAYDDIENSGILDNVPDCLKNYFDYESYGRDLAMDHIEFDGHYFHSNY